MHSFFNDLLSRGWPAPFWHGMRTFYDGDIYPDLGLYFRFFDVAVRGIVLKFRRTIRLIPFCVVYHSIWRHCEANTTSQTKARIIIPNQMAGMACSGLT